MVWPGLVGGVPYPPLPRPTGYCTSLPSEIKSIARDGYHCAIAFFIMPSQTKSLWAWPPFILPAFFHSLFRVDKAFRFSVFPAQLTSVIHRPAEEFFCNLPVSILGFRQFDIFFRFYVSDNFINGLFHHFFSEPLMNSFISRLVSTCGLL